MCFAYFLGSVVAWHELDDTRRLTGVHLPIRVADALGGETMREGLALFVFKRNVGEGVFCADG